MIFLTRWISPNEFGLIGMMSLFISIGTNFTDSGLSNSLIRTNNANEKDYSTVFFANLIISLVTYFIVFTIAPSISMFYNEPELSILIRVYGLIFILIGISAVQLSILQKQLKFKNITLISFPSTIVGISVGLVLGLNNFGVWSIICMYLTIELLKSTLLWIFSDWYPKLVFSKSKFLYHYKFGYKLMLSGLIDTLYNNLYNILIGKFYSTRNLGLYERSKQLSQYPASTVTGVIMRVCFPLLSNLKNDLVKLQVIYKKLLRISFFITCPFLLGAAAIAEPLFIIFLGDDWSDAIILFQILCFGMLLLPIHAFNLNILKVFGYSNLFLKVEVYKKIIGFITIIFAFKYGVIVIACSYVLVSYISLIINMYYSSKIINYKISSQLTDILSTLILSIFSSLIIYRLINLLSFNSIFINIILSLLIGTLFYLLVNMLFKKSPLHELIYLIKTYRI